MFSMSERKVFKPKILKMLNVTVAAVNLIDCQMKTAQGVPTINAPCKPHHHATIPYKVVSIINPSVYPKYLSFNSFLLLSDRPPVSSFGIGMSNFWAGAVVKIRR